MERNKAQEIFNTLTCLFPNACCELNYNNNFELLIAVILSSQTTDKKVNDVTKVLFNRYPDCYSLSNASVNDVFNIIKPLGIASVKSKRIIDIAKIITNNYNRIVPNDYESLVNLPGVGRKTANVVLSEGFNVPRIAVDTHVARCSYLLGLTNEKNNVNIIEEDLMKLFDEKDYKDVHLKILFFGRYLCKAIKPECSKCPFINICKKYKK